MIKSHVPLLVLLGCLSIALAGCAERAADGPDSDAAGPTARDDGSGRAAERRQAEPEVPVAFESAGGPELSADQIADGWIALFDGETLFGWEPNDADSENPVNWQVEDGAIVADAGGPGLLLTHVPFADYELEVEYRLEKGGNSGVFLRTIPDPKNPAEDCYELNFCDTHPEYKTASLVGRAKPDQQVQGDGEWQSVRATLRGPRITVHVGGQQVLDFTDESEHVRLSGRIGLQKNEGRIAFRRVVLKPLDLKPIFTGKDLAGWHEVSGSQSEFTVQDGQIHVENGRGYLETDKTWADFVLQTEAITHGEGLNSGIFFRALPGTEAEPANGYEFQIQNQFEGGDRTKPRDFGTGGIYRRVPARHVVSDDNEWTHLTLVAHGPRIATWVNGYPTVAWTDERAPHENPREGLRTEAGHISLQGHDPTTNLDFRKLRIAEFSVQEDGEGRP